MEKGKQFKLSPEQRSSASIASGSPFRKIMSHLMYTKMSPRSSGQEVSDAQRAVNNNKDERNTFLMSEKSVKALSDKQNKAGGSLDMGVSGDALARAKAGKTAKYDEGR